MKNLRRNKERAKISKLVSTLNSFHIGRHIVDPSQPYFGSCIQDSLSLHYALKKMGIKSKLLCSDVLVYNSNGKSMLIDEIEGNVEIDEVENDRGIKMKVTEHLSGVDESKPPAFYTSAFHANSVKITDGYNGHVLVETKYHIIDSTPAQFTRRANDGSELLSTPFSLIWNKEDFEPFQEGEEWLVKSKMFHIGSVNEGMRTITKVGEDTWMVLSLRRDKRVEDYHRWDHPDFQAGAKLCSSYIIQLKDKQGIDPNELEVIPVIPDQAQHHRGQQFDTEFSEV